MNRFKAVLRNLMRELRAWRIRRRFRSKMAKHKAAREHLDRHISR